MSAIVKLLDFAEAGSQFIDVMDDYMARQQDDPNFDPRQELHDLYADLVYIYENANKPPKS